MPQVSVIIPTYNYAHFIEDAVKSVLQQSYKDFEIIVVDDGSTDDTKITLEPYIQRKDIRYVYQKNMGLPGARNTGIRHSQGEFIGFLDADDLWEKDKLKLQVELFDAHPEIGFCYGNIRKFKQGLASKKTAFEELRPAAGKITCQLLQNAFLPMPTVMVRREAFEKTGMFNESLDSCEDLDMWLRLSLAYPCAYIDRVIAWYRTHTTSMSANTLKIAERRLDVLKTFIKNNESLLKECCGTGLTTKVLGIANENAGRYALSHGQKVKGKLYLEQASAALGASWKRNIIRRLSIIPGLIPQLYNIKMWMLAKNNFRPLQPKELPNH